MPALLPLIGPWGHRRGYRATCARYPNKVVDVKGTGKRFRLLVLQGQHSVKIEVTPVLRGSVYPPENRELSPRAADAFGYASMPVLNFADLYAGKICAALDRQHPRDLYDAFWLLEQAHRPLQR